MTLGANKVTCLNIVKYIHIYKFLLNFTFGVTLTQFSPKLNELELFLVFTITQN